MQVSILNLYKHKDKETAKTSSTGPELNHAIAKNILLIFPIATGVWCTGMNIKPLPTQNEDIG